MVIEYYSQYCCSKARLYSVAFLSLLYFVSSIHVLIHFYAENAKQKRLFSSSALYELFELTDVENTNEGDKNVDDGCDLPVAGK